VITIVKEKRFFTLIWSLLLIVLISTSFSIIKFPNSNNSEPLNSIVCSAEPRKITFSGYNWTVRTTNEQLQGPGPNYFGDSNESVWLDNDGFLHLKVIYNNSKWYCAEIYSDLSFGYGTYTFRLSPGFEDLDVNVVVGLFTYLDDENEIDIEFARWGQTGASNGQYTIQPASSFGNLYQYNLAETGEKSVHSFTWCAEYIRFWSAWGSSMSYNAEKLIAEWYYTGADNPAPSTERVHLNFWLMSGLAPIDSLETEIIIEEFKFTESNCDDPIPLPLWLIITIISVAIAGICTFILILKKRNR